MASYLLIIMFIVGLLMYLLCKGEAKEIGRMLLFSSFIGFAVGFAPGTVRLLHG